MYISIYFICFYSSKNAYIKLNLINAELWDLWSLNSKYTLTIKMSRMFVESLSLCLLDLILNEYSNPTELWRMSSGIVT